MGEVCGEDGGDAGDEGGDGGVEFFQIWGEEGEEFGGVVWGCLFIVVAVIIVIRGVLEVENDDGDEVSELLIYKGLKLSVNV